jgi:cation:H+ antiporter
MISSVIPFSPYILLVAGVILLLRGAEELVRGSTSIASRFGISKLIIGLTVVAFGTSAPEFAVNAVGALHGETELVMGNILGSNIANLLLVLGIVALLAPPVLRSRTVWQEIPISFLAVIVLGLTANNALSGHIAPDTITRADGLLILAFFGLFLAYMFSRMRHERSELAQEEPRRRTGLWSGIVRVVAGALGLYFGGTWIVSGASHIALILGLTPYVIGATVVAVGTSLPELAASVVAARRDESDLAIGNIIGSNIFNILWIVGITAVISPIPVSGDANRDLVILGGVTILLFAFMFIGHPNKLKRWDGAVFILAYAAYVAMLIA